VESHGQRRRCPGRGMARGRGWAGPWGWHGGMRGGFCGPWGMRGGGGAHVRFGCHGARGRGGWGAGAAAPPLGAWCRQQPAAAAAAAEGSSASAPPPADTPAPTANAETVEIAAASGQNHDVEPTVMSTDHDWTLVNDGLGLTDVDAATTAVEQLQVSSPAAATSGIYSTHRA